MVQTIVICPQPIDFHINVNAVQTSTNTKYKKDINDNGKNSHGSSSSTNVMTAIKLSMDGGLRFQ